MGALMAVHKKKKEEPVRNSDKIFAEHLKIAGKVKEVGAKKQKLKRLETKVVYDIIYHRQVINPSISETASFLELSRIEMRAWDILSSALNIPNFF